MVPKERTNFFNFFKKGSELWIECLYITLQKKDKLLKIEGSCLNFYLFSVLMFLSKKKNNEVAICYLITKYHWYGIASISNPSLYINFNKTLPILL